MAAAFPAALRYGMWRSSRPSSITEHSRVWRMRSITTFRSSNRHVLWDQGDLAGALATYRESLAVIRRLTDADRSNAVWQRDLSYSLTQLSLCHEQLNDRSATLVCAEESLRIDERLAVLDPSNATWQRDLMFSRALVARLRPDAA